MSTSEGTVQFWFEFASTYSYVAAARVEALARDAGVAIAWRPFLLGPIFRAQGWNDSPFNIYPAKGRYMWRDLERLCARHGLPFRHPSVFPRNGLLAARVACAGEGAGWCPEFVRAVYSANFAEDRDIADPEVIGSILSTLGQRADELLARAGEARTKERLRLSTEEAVQSGIFGAPSFLVGDELYWGSDRLEQAIERARELQGAPAGAP